MTLVTIEGVYENGKVELAERPEGIERAKVMVTFLPEARTRRAEQNRKGTTRAARRAALPATDDRYPQTLRDEYKLRKARSMTPTLEAVERAVTQLSAEELAQFRQWFTE